MIGGENPSIGNRHSQMSFAQVPTINIQRSTFDRSFGMKDTFDFDYLIPIFVDEILPGDTANLNVNAFGRLATQLVPIMDNMYIDFFFFFVPNRLLWTNWERFNGAQDDPTDSTDYVLPTLTTTAGGPEVGTIYDKFGLPTDVAGDYSFQTLPLRAYNLIWNEWFRDQNLQDSVIKNMDDGPDALADYTLLKRCKVHDYFTSCLPWPQKGDAVELPLGTSANVKTNATALVTGAQSGLLMSDVGGGTPINRGLSVSVAGGVYTNATTGGTVDEYLYPNNLYADLSTATAATINQLREAFSMQALFELDARGGTRYIEILRAHFGVISPDFRLQRPEFLGGGQSRISSHPVPQTSPTAGADPQGQLAAFGTVSTTGSIGFTKSFVEHGYVIGLACARADITYQQGLDKMWQRSTRYDFYWPKLSELGEQAVLTSEIYCTGTPATDDTVFGYQERYAEYRYKASQIKGEFRSTYATSLDFWHMAEEFGSTPALNNAFIQSNTPVDRAIAVPSEPHILFDAWFKYTHARPMPVRPIPAQLGRF